MSDFTINDDIVSKIVKQYGKFGIGEEQVKSLLGFYREYSKGMKHQYLAHVIRTNVSLDRYPQYELDSCVRENRA